MLSSVSTLQKSSNPDLFSVLSCRVALSSCCIHSTKQATGCTAGVTETIPKHIKLTDILKNSEVRTGWEDTDNDAIFHNKPILNLSLAFTQLRSFITFVRTWMTFDTDKVSLVRFSMYCVRVCLSQFFSLVTLSLFPLAP